MVTFATEFNAETIPYAFSWGFVGAKIEIKIPFTK